MNKILLFACLACLCSVGFLLLYYLGHDVYSGNWIDYKPSQQCAGKNITTMNYTIPVGVSMRPTIWNGNKVYYTAYDPQVIIVEGDVLRVNYGGDAIIHRVVGVYPEYFFLKGDNAVERDPVAYRYSSIVAVICAVSYN